MGLAWAGRRVTELGTRAGEQRRRLKRKQGWGLRKETACGYREGAERGHSLKKWAKR